MTSYRKRVLFASVIAVIAWWSVVLGEIYFKCRIPDSEACGWAHAFFPKLTVPLFFVIIGLPAFVVAYLIGGWLFRRET